MNWLRLSLAILLPLAILAGGAASITSWRAPKEIRAERNAGAVVNAQRRDVSAPEWIEDRLAEARPRVLVLGNSVALTDVDVPTLARGLGYPRDKVQVVSVPNSIGSDWYAILRNRVYANGHAPDLVIALSPLRGALETLPSTPSMSENLTAQLAGDEPASVRAKMGGWRVGSVWIDALRGNAHRLRTQLLRGLRDRLGGDRLDAATGRVFAPGKMVFSRTRGTVPVVDVRGDGVVPASALPSPADSLIPELRDLVCEHGGKLVLVRPPLSPALPTEYADDVGEDVEAALRALLDPRCATLLDLSDLAVGPADFRDPVHLDGSGARRMSAILAARLARLRAAGKASGLWIAPPAPAVRIDGGLQLAPAESLRITAEQAWAGPAAAFQVQVVARGASGEATLGGRAPDQVVREPGGRIRWTWGGEQPGAPWVLAVRAGEALDVLGVGIGRGEARTLLAGTERGLDRPAVDLLARPFEVVPRVEARRFEGAVHLPGGRLPPAWELPELRPVLDALAGEGAVDVGACSPVEVRDHGRPVPIAASCRDLWNGPGRSCFDGSRLWFRHAGDDLPPLERRFGAGCAGGAWLGPGEHLIVDASAADRSELGDVVRRVELAILSSEPEARVRATVRSAAGEEGSVRPASVGRWAHNLERPIAVDQDVAVTVENRSDHAWVLIRELLLR